MASLEPYQIAIPDERLHNLRAKLDTVEFPDELEAAEWDYGVPLADMKRLVLAWKDRFDWRKQEEELNKLPNFQTKVEVEGFEPLNIHFVYQKSENPNAIPLLFVHGCKFSPYILPLLHDLLACFIGPGSFIEVVKILPLLTKGGEDAPAFHVVAPSLPNFGFSDGVKKRGFALPQYAETCHKLMTQLGYDEYGK